MNLIQFLLTILNVVANNPTIRAGLIQPLAQLLVDALPDVTEDNIAALLRELADQIAAANP